MARTVKAGRNARWLVEIRSATATHRESERASPSRSAGRRGSATREVFAQNQLTGSVVESADSPAPEADDTRGGAAATRLDLQSFSPLRAGVAAIDSGARDGSKVDDRAPACQGGDARRTRRGRRGIDGCLGPRLVRDVAQDPAPSDPLPSGSSGSASVCQTETPPVVEVLAGLAERIVKKRSTTSAPVS